MSSSGRRQMSTAESQAAKQHSNRAPSPDFRGKSVPHSEKSDSSDVESVHSLPIEGINVPISYADIAKNAEKAKEKKTSPEKIEKVPKKDKSPKLETDSNFKKDKSISILTSNNNNLNHVKSPPDLHSVKNFPAMPTDVSPKSVSPPDVNDTRSFPAIPVEIYNLKSPPIDAHIQSPNFPIISPHNETTTNLKQFPPDVNDTKSFPAMPTDGPATKGFFSLPVDVNNVKSFPAITSNNNKGLTVEKTNVRNASISSGRARTVSPGNKAISAKNSVLNNNINDNVNTVAVSQNYVCNDIQNDLSVSILHLVYDK